MDTASFLIPMRDFRDAKSRLNFLDEACRAELAKRCFRRTLNAIAHIDTATAYVMTSSEAVKSECENFGVQVIEEPPHRAGFRTLVRDGASELPSADLMGVLMADLPYVSSADIEYAVGAAQTTGLVLAPDRHWLGTNLVLMRRMVPERLLFGAPDSYLQHSACFQELGKRFRTLRLFGLSFDVDTEDDYRTLSRHLRVQTERES